ncbi:hypothetical protein [Neisseria gonorrhoeae]|uniref:hypothetical protein n=1 Tax=Neisseria gonorrhoeae TaxID=485 RepID=UPI001584ABBC|nr:hypothetical protein [Neisseria gonorrhoeae]
MPIPVTLKPVIPAQAEIKRSVRTGIKTPKPRVIPTSVGNGGGPVFGRHFKTQTKRARSSISPTPMRSDRGEDFCRFGNDKPRQPQCVVKGFRRFAVSTR